MALALTKLAVKGSLRPLLGWVTLSSVGKGSWMGSRYHDSMGNMGLSSTAIYPLLREHSNIPKSGTAILKNLFWTFSSLVNQISPPAPPAPHDASHHPTLSVSEKVSCITVSDSSMLNSDDSGNFLDKANSTASWRVRNSWALVMPVSKKSFLSNALTTEATNQTQNIHRVRHLGRAHRVQTALS